MAAIAMGATGFFLGVRMLIATTSGDLNESDVALAEVHGAAQLLGWCGLFVIGVASHVVPRFQGNAPLPFPWPQRATLVLIVGGLVLRGIAQPWETLPLRPLVLLAGAIGVAIGFSLFAATMVMVLLRGRGNRRRVEHWLWLGIIGAVVTGALYLALATSSRHQLLTNPHWNNAFRTMALYGLLLPFVFAVSGRALSGLLALRPRNTICDRTSLLLLAVGLPLLLLAQRPSAEPALQAVAEITTASALVAFTIGFRVLEPRMPGDRSVPAPPHTWFSWYVRSAYAWLLVAAALLTASALETLGAQVLPLAGTPELHVLAVGFFTTLIVGVAARLLPLFEGHPLAWSAMLIPALFLLQVATALRLIGALDEAPPYLTGLSGLAGVAGFALGILPSARLLVSRQRPFGSA